MNLCFLIKKKGIIPTGTFFLEGWSIWSFQNVLDYLTILGMLNDAEVVVGPF
jgi:hypothetical protein